MIKGYQAKIDHIYEKIREKEEFNLQSKKAEINSKIPQIAHIEDKINKLCIELSLSSMRDIPNRDSYIETIKNEITDLRMNKCELLVINGYAQDYLDRHYTCSKCKDTGFIGNNKCSCYKSKMVQVYYNNSELKEILKTNNFQNFNFNYFITKNLNEEHDSPKRNMEKIYEKIWCYIEEFQETKENQLFYGNSGTGKTFLSLCLAKELLDRGYLVVYRTAGELIQGLREANLSNDTRLEDLLVNCDLLIIDDLGTEQITNYSKTELFNLINKKLLKNKKMLISSNYTLEELTKTYSERITSRLLGNFTLNKFYGDDIRVKKNLDKIR